MSSDVHDGVVVEDDRVVAGVDLDRVDRGARPLGGLAADGGASIEVASTETCSA